jgi:hypothetical protein
MRLIFDPLAEHCRKKIVRKYPDKAGDILKALSNAIVDNYQYGKSIGLLRKSLTIVFQVGILQFTFDVIFIHNNVAIKVIFLEHTIKEDLLI